MKPEELLHLFSPYLATDRFRALLRNSDLPTTSEGAALLVDISGFTPLTTRLVVEYGPERASEELKRRLNPMFEAIAGQVFQHGGSVIRFTGDGFIAWFDDSHIDQSVGAGASIPGTLRAVAAGLEMQDLMRFFRGLQLKVGIGAGNAYRWVVGQPHYGLTDVLLGPAVEAMVSVGNEVQPGQVMVHRNMIARLYDEKIDLTLATTGSATVNKIPETLSKAARRHRWTAWEVEGSIDGALSAIRPYVDSAIRERVESGLGDYVAELRYALPMFMHINDIAPDAPNAHATLDNYVRTVQSVLISFGGRFVSVEVADKGTLFFGVFGAPISYGDDAERAIRAAMALREMSSGPDSVAVERIGVSRGLLYAGTIGGEVRHEYSTIGDETNIASRLMSSAAPRQILSTSAVRDELGSRIIFRDLPPILVKGREELVHVTEPISVGSYQQAHVGELIGREHELKHLHKALNAVSKGYPRLVRIEGQAGIGKSRLVAEISRLAIAQGFRAAGGDCVSTGHNIAFLPWRDVLFTLIGLGLDVSREDNIARLKAFIEKADPNWMPRVPLLGDLLKLSIDDTSTTAMLDGQTRHQALSALVIDLLLHLAAQQPLLIVLEDTHWIDELSEALAMELARRLIVDPAQILLLLVHRPMLETEFSQNGIQAMNEMHIHTHLMLDELSRAAVIEMLESYLHVSIPPDLARFVYDRSHGNPFYIQEVIDALTETGYIKVVGGIVFVERDLQSADLPHTIHKIVQARIDRLTEIDKLVLKVAAVIGHQFQMRVLEKSIPVQIGYQDLLQSLRTLEARDFSYQETPEPDLTYLFKHAITQEVTYQSLLFAQRRQLHQAVAATLALVTPDAIERLAYHFARSGDDDRARHYLLLAGEKAFREYANQAALGHFTQALSLARSDEERFEIKRRRIQIMLRLGDMPGVRQQLPVLADLATTNNRDDWQAVVHIFWANHYMQTSAWPKVIDESQKAIAVAQKIHNDELAWEAYMLLRGAFLGINQREEAEYLIRVMQPLVERLGDEHRRVQLRLLEIEDQYMRDARLALKDAEGAIGQVKQLADPVLEANSWSVLARLYSRENQLPAALNAYGQQIALLRQIGDRRYEGLTLLNIGSVLVNLGELSEGNTHLLDAYKILHQIGERSGEATSLVNLGLIAWHHQAYDEALAYMQRGLALQRALDTEADVARTLFYMANTYIAKRELSPAADALDEARGLFESTSLFQHIAELYTALAEIDILRDDLSAAQADIKHLLPRLEQRQVSDLFLPGLAYWRTIQVLEKSGNLELAGKLRAAFRAQAEITLNHLSEARRDAFINKIWYHAALLNEPVS
ncbi:MAG: AAA family ATPase [Chloroflexota bacterium]